MSRLPKNRAPVTPGEILLEEFLKPLGMTQRELAQALHIPYQRVNEIIRGKRAITVDTALRLAKFFGTSPEVWLNLQQRVDIYRALQRSTLEAVPTLKEWQAQRVAE